MKQPSMKPLVAGWAAIVACLPIWGAVAATMSSSLSVTQARAESAPGEAAGGAVTEFGVSEQSAADPADERPGLARSTRKPPRHGASDKEPAPADFFVATHGDDANSGAADAPFATLARARDAVRAMIRQGLAKNIRVEIAGGTYPCTEPLVFGPEDSGSPEFSIVYAAAPDEHVVIDGGRRIGGWKKGAGPLWTAVLPEAKTGAWRPRQLFINGQRAVRARTPNDGWCEGKSLEPIEHDSVDQRLEIRLQTAGGKGIFGWAREFEYDQAPIPGGIAAWSHPGDIELVSLRHNEGGRKAVESIDPVAQTVTLRPPHRWAPKCFGNDWFNGVPDGRCYLENALEFLDSPGEWYLDCRTGVLSYWPRPGEDPARWDAAAPVVQKTLLAITGSKERPVVNLHFRGLHVAHVDWPLPPQGYAGLFCCNVPVFREGGDPGHRFIEAAVEMTHARSCSFRDGGVFGAGGMGLVLGEGTADIAIEGNRIEQTGAGGLGLGQCNVGFGYLRAAPAPDPGDYARFRVCNNYVRHCGLDYFGAVGIALFRMRESTIAHNLVHDTAYCGVVFPGDQDPSWNFVGDNVFERNHIFRDMRVTQDGAGLYASFAHRGTAVRDNLIHDSSGNPMSGGICLDGCTGIAFERNVVYHNPVWSLVLFRPDDLAENSWTGNLVMPTRESGVSANRPKTLFDGRSGWELQPGRKVHSPPAEFIEAISHYAGLEPAYRARLQGTAPRRCELHVLEEGLAWQLDFPEEGRGVAYRIDARAGKGAAPPRSAASDRALKLQALDAASSYRLQAYAGPIQSSPTDSSVQDFTAGPPFPMVRGISPLQIPAIPATASGAALMEQGLALPDGSTAVWAAYQRVR